MTVKAENRWNKVNRNWATVKLEESKMGRMVDRLIYNANNLEERYDAQKVEIERLNAELDRARSAYKRRCAEIECMKQDIKVLQTRIDEQKKETIGWFTAFQNETKGHYKLSAIVRMALSPEEYRTWRQAAAEIYPNLFENIDGEVAVTGLELR